MPSKLMKKLQPKVIFTDARMFQAEIRRLQYAIQFEVVFFFKLPLTVEWIVLDRGHLSSQRKFINDYEISHVAFGTDYAVKVALGFALKDYNINSLKSVMIGANNTTKPDIMRLQNNIPYSIILWQNVVVLLWEK